MTGVDITGAGVVSHNGEVMSRANQAIITGRLWRWRTWRGRSWLGRLWSICRLNDLQWLQTFSKFMLVPLRQLILWYFQIQMQNNNRYEWNEDEWTWCELLSMILHCQARSIQKNESKEAIYRRYPPSNRTSTACLWDVGDYSHGCPHRMSWRRKFFDTHLRRRDIVQNVQAGRCLDFSRTSVNSVENFGRSTARTAETF